MPDGAILSPGQTGLGQTALPVDPVAAAETFLWWEREDLGAMQESLMASYEDLRVLLHNASAARKRKYKEAVEFWLQRYAELLRDIESRLGQITNPDNPYRVEQGLALFASIRKKLDEGMEEKNIGTSETLYSLHDLPDRRRDDLSGLLTTRNGRLINRAREAGEKLQRLRPSLKPVASSPIAGRDATAPRRKNFIRAVGANMWERKEEIVLGALAGFGVRMAFIAAATALTLPAAPMIAVGGVVAGMAAAYAKAHYASHKTGQPLTHKAMLKAVFKGAAFALLGEAIGFGLGSLMGHGDFTGAGIHKTISTTTTTTTVTATPTPLIPAAPVVSPPISVILPPPQPVMNLAPPGSLSLTPPMPHSVIEATLLPPPNPGSDIRAAIMDRLNGGKFNAMPGHLKARLLAALGTSGHENWRLVMARLADAGYYDFNGLGGAARDETTRRLGIGFYGFAGRIAETFSLNDPMAGSVRKSVRWLAAISRYGNALNAG